MTFDDGFVKRYVNRGSLQKILVREKTDKIHKQLDYILVSTRWKSCVLNCRPKWGPAKHRDIHGDANDHALVQSEWKWRLRSVKSKKIRDFSQLYVNTEDSDGNPVVNKLRESFENAVQQKLTEL